MPFELDTPTLIALCAAISVVLFAEAVYLLGFSTASYRSNVNRRLKLSSNQPDREAILIQLRRERGLTKDGLFRFGIAADEITYGADVETAMRNLYFRVGQEDLPLFVTAVSIQGSTGGNLSEILENLSRVIRERFKMRRKIRALAAEGKFSALFLSGLPVVIFFLLQVVAPEFYASIMNQYLTKQWLSIASIWMILGNMVMYKMCNFRI